MLREQKKGIRNRFTYSSGVTPTQTKYSSNNNKKRRNNIQEKRLLLTFASRASLARNKQTNPQKLRGVELRSPLRGSLAKGRQTRRISWGAQPEYYAIRVRPQETPNSTECRIVSECNRRFKGQPRTPLYIFFGIARVYKRLRRPCLYPKKIRQIFVRGWRVGYLLHDAQKDTLIGSAFPHASYVQTQS